MTQAAGPRLERVKYLGTTWYERNAGYWARRAGLVVVALVILAVVALVSSAAFIGILRVARGNPGAHAAVLGIYGGLAVLGLFEGYIRFCVAAAQKRDHILEADYRHFHTHDWFQRKNKAILGGAARVPMILLLFCVGGGYVLGVELWQVFALSQKYASPEEYSAVRRARGLPALDYKELLSDTNDGQRADRADEPVKLPLVGRSWAKRGVWYWTRRGVWTVFFVWIFLSAAKIAVEAVELCAHGHWLQNRALAVGLALVPVAWGAFMGGRALWVFRKAVREGRDIQPNEIRVVGWISERQRAAAGVGGLLLFWYFYHSPKAALMHAGSGSSRAFARYMLLFVVGILFSWAIACFGRHFGPEEYSASRARQAAQQV